MTSIWVTGAGGFIGSHLVEYLRQSGERVGGFCGSAAAPTTDGSWIPGPLHEEGMSRLAGIVGLPDVVFHLAGGSSVAASLRDPAGDFDRTVNSSARLLEWVRRRAPDARLIVVSSAAVYGASHDGTIDEDTPLRPCSPYGYHKQAMELLCRSYSESFGLRTALARLFSVYGPGLRKQLLWDLCGRLATDRAAALGGTGNELRDWTHVDDVVRFLAGLTELASPAAPVLNGGSGVATSVREVALAATEAFNLAPDAIRFSGERRPGDPFSLVAAGDSGFDWRVTVRDGVADYVRWFVGQQG